MTDYSRDRLGPDDEDRLPWLEPVEEEPEEGGIGSARLLLWLGAAVLVIGLLIGGFVMMRAGDKAAAGDGALIKAPDAYYKERPAEEAVATGDDAIVYSASKGNEVESVIDTSGTAELPVNVDRPLAPEPAPAAVVAKTAAGPAAPARPTAAIDQPSGKATTKAPAKPAPVAAKPAPVAAPSSGGSIVQLGAFSSQAKANAAWKSLSSRFAFLAGLSQSVVPVESGDKTLYRLRASGGNAGDICGRLRTAGESCSVIG